MRDARSGRDNRELVPNAVNTVFCVSASAEETARLLADGPRRDFVELAHAVNAKVVYRAVRPSRRGLLGRLAGPHIKQAFATSRQLANGDVCFADGEHLGVSLLGFLFARRKRRVRVVMLGHLVDRPWKRVLLAATTRLVPNGTLVLHSQTQLERIRGWVARSWRVALVPYQVDTDYWVPELPSAEEGLPIVLAVGSENRDYDTLIEAATGLPVQVVIAAGSHWARQTAGAGHLPDNVRYLDKPLPFAELRSAYASAAMVVVPVHDVTNQSGVTVILEAMSMARPCIVTASRGQRECVVGSTVQADGALDESTRLSRGPHVFGGVRSGAATGMYVPPNDAGALRAAIVRLIDHPALGDDLGQAARVAAKNHFSIERYVESVAALLVEAGAPRAACSAVGEAAL